MPSMNNMLASDNVINAEVFESSNEDQQESSAVVEFTSSIVSPKIEPFVSISQKRYSTKPGVANSIILRKRLLISSLRRMP